MKTVLPSKLRAPRVRPDALPRARLLAHLASRADVPLVTVSGAAGYGKTTLIRQWLQDDDRAFAWVSLDGGDNDPVVLLRYLAAALDHLEPLPADIVSAVGGNAEILLPALGRAIVAGRRPFILVLDDLHLIADDAAWGIVGAVAELIPEGSQLVLSGRRLRTDGRIRRRMQDGVVELTESDLRFSEDETAAVLSRSGVALDAVAVDGVTARTEGWPAGVYLAVLAMQDHRDPVGLVDGLHGDHRLVAEYFRDELLQQLPADIRRFLVHTSILDRASGPLCDAVLDRAGSGEVLEELAASRNLFIVPLDHDRTWYRYHHLFGELLLSELRLTEPQIEAELRRRAGRWCAANGEPGTAIDQALLVPDMDLVERIVGENVFGCVTGGRHATLDRWLQALPPQEIRVRGPLLLASGWAHVGAGRSDDLDHVLQLADGMQFDGPMPDGTISFDVARSMLWTVSGAGGVKQLAERAAEVVEPGPGGSPWWSFAVLLEAVALWLSGAPDPLRIMEGAEYAGRGNPAVHAVATSHLALMHLRAGQIELGDRLVTEAVDELRTHRLEDSMFIALVHAVHAEAAARSGRTEESRRAAHHARRLVESAHTVIPRAQLHHRLVLAEAALVRRDLDEARDDLAHADRMLHQEPDAVVLIEWFEHLSARLGIGPEDGPDRAGITDGEFRVLELLPTHLSLEEIGQQIFVSRNTVKSHTVSIYRKLGVSSRGAAVERARALGLLLDR